MFVRFPGLPSYLRVRRCVSWLPPHFVTLLPLVHLCLCKLQFRLSTTLLPAKTGRRLLVPPLPTPLSVTTADGRSHVALPKTVIPSTPDEVQLAATCTAPKRAKHVPHDQVFATAAAFRYSMMSTTLPQYTVLVHSSSALTLRQPLTLTLRASVLPPSRLSPGIGLAVSWDPD